MEWRGNLNGDGFEFSVKVTWTVLIAFVKALVLTTVLIAALLSHPGFLQAIAALRRLAGW